MILNKLLGEIETGDILDVGCGSGQFTEVLAAALASFKSVTGVDVEEDYLAEARLKFPGESYRFLQIDGNGLPFSDSAFDMVVISNALHHVPDPEATLGEMYRVLKSGGYFLIREMHRNQLTKEQESHKLYHHLRADIDRLSGISHNHTFLREDLIRMFNSISLGDRHVSEIDPESATDPDSIREYTDKMNSWMEAMERHSEQEKIEHRVREIGERIRKFGISSPPQLVLMGRK